jgi:hypothetical protein
MKKPKITAISDDFRVDELSGKILHKRGVEYVNCRVALPGFKWKRPVIIRI